MNPEPNPVPLFFSAFLLSVGLFVKVWVFDFPALALLFMSLLLAVFSLHGSRFFPQPDLLIIGACLFAQWIVLAALARAMFPHVFWLVVVAPVVLVIPSLREGRLAYILVAVHFLMGLAFIHALSNPRMDVYVFQRDAASAFLSGTNPYSITFPNIYEPYTGFYPPGYVENGRVTAGFSYLPASLLMVLPGYLLGDVRLSHLAATSLAGVLMFSMSRQPLARLAVVLFLFSPITFVVVGPGWTEPLLLVLVVGACWAFRRSSMALGAILLGALFAAKQHIVLITPLFALLPVPHRRRALLVAALCAVLLVAPFALTDIHGFYRSTFGGLAVLPFRPDSLSLPALIASLGGPKVAWLSFAVLPFAILFILKRCPRSLAGFLIGLALEYFAFFLFAKHAFINHYFLVFGALCCAIVMIEPHPNPTENRA